ncbi:hypothetical protein ABTP93_21630, partial [Acinetobacter baumannii]
ELAQNNFISDLIIRAGEENINFDDKYLNTEQYLTFSWRLILAKKNLADLLKARNDEKTILFYDKHSMMEWISLIDPCSPSED